jgi:hypothetical protein
MKCLLCSYEGKSVAAVLVAHAWSASDLQKFLSCAEHAKLKQVRKTAEITNADFNPFDLRYAVRA